MNAMLDVRSFLDDLDTPLNTVARPYQPKIVPPTPRPSRPIPDDLREILDSVDLDEDDPLVESALAAHNHAEKCFVRIDEVTKIARSNVDKARTIRDTFRYKEVIPDPQEAKAKLRSLAIQEKFAVPDALSRNMQALCSYYNNKEHGKRFKTERAGGATSMLIIWRTR